MSINKCSIASNSTQDLKCENLGIQMPDKDLAIRHIHDAEYHVWRESGGKDPFQITPFEVLLSLSDVEIETFYAQKFRELQLMYAPALPEVSETPDSEQVELVGEAPSDEAHQEANVEQPTPSLPQPTPQPTTTTKPSPKALPRASPTHHNSPNIDWDELAPRIIVPVAKELFAGRPMRKTSQGIRVGNYGGIAVDEATGTYFDHDDKIGGGVVEMIQRELSLDARSAFHWLQEHGYLDDTFSVSGASHIKPRPKRKAKSDGKDYYHFGLKLWSKSRPIPRSFNHAARRWAAHRNLLPLLLPFPTGIRYGIYDDKKRGECPYLIVLACPLSVWGDAYPDLPKPEPEKTQFQALWIDRLGNPVEQEDGGNKRTYGRFGEVDDSAVLCIGDPTADRVSVAEGVADALSIYSRRDGAVLATLGKPGGLCDKPHALESLALDGRDVTIFEDNDSSPDPKKQKQIDDHKQKVKRLGQRIISLGGSANRIRIPPEYKDPAHAAQHQPFPIVNRADFDLAVSRFREKGSSEPERAAWLSLMEGGGCHA